MVHINNGERFPNRSSVAFGNVPESVLMLDVPACLDLVQLLLFIPLKKMDIGELTTFPTRPSQDVLGSGTSCGSRISPRRNKPVR